MSQNERIEQLYKKGLIEASTYEELAQRLALSKDIADHMIENQIGTYQLPLGLGFNLLVDQKSYTVPMATEEPSVIAAQSFAAKTIKASGGFTTKHESRLMIGQVAISHVIDSHDKKTAVIDQKDKLIAIANEAHPSIVKRGGGAVDIEVRIIEEKPTMHTPRFFVVHLLVDTQEAMGANMVNTMMEALKAPLEAITGGTVLMGILSNYALSSLVTTRCKIAPSFLKRGDVDGDYVRDRIIEAGQFALVDPYRAVTHNKGIMNGIDAVVLATGNDTRAIASGIHAYAARTGQYQALTHWSKDEAGNLIGSMTLPLPIGSVGGSISIHPGATFNHGLLGNPDAKTLASIIASVGLAQNFAALRALVTEGIQRGHMSLQAKSLAMNAGAKGEEIDLLATRLKREKLMNLDVAKEKLEIIRREKK